MNDEERKQLLEQKLTHARVDMSRSIAGVRRAADLPNRMKHSMKSSPAVWVAGAVLLGGAFSALMPFRRRDKASQNVWSDLSARFGRPRPHVAGGVAISAMVATARFLFSIMQPALLRVIKNKMSGRARPSERPIPT